MRSEQFKNRPSQIRGAKEKTTKSRSWDRVIYMVILGSLLLVVGYFLISSYFYVSGEGRVVGTHLETRFPSDIKVTDLYVETGENISTGDSLFKFMAVEKNRTVTELEEEREEREEEIIELRSDIELMQTERDETRNKIAFYRDRKQLLEKEVKLDIEPANKLHSVNSKLVELNSDLEVLKKEISLLSIKLNRARQKSQKIAESMFSEETLFRETPGTRQTYLAPKSGQVARIYKESSEFALRSEPVMSIRVQRPKVRIQAIFREQHIEHLSIGDEVTVTFDNGEESKGKIVDLKEENQDMIDDEDLSKLSNRYIVEIEPIDDKARKVWESLGHLGVTVTKSIYSL